MENNVTITERDLIDRVVASRSLDILEKNKIEKSSFTKCKDYIDFIYAYHGKHNEVPDESVMQTKFGDYMVHHINATDDYLAYYFKENKHNSKFVNILQQTASITDTDSFVAVEYLEEQLEKLKADSIRYAKTTGVDIISATDDRYKKYLYNSTEEAKAKKMKFGIAQLDHYLMGIEEDDYICVFARTTVGKSWIAEYFGVQAWLQGKRVLYYSGEMDTESVGYRFDTMHSNFSNRALREGNASLGDNLSTSHYREYVKTMSNKTGFIVVTPHDFGGDMPTMKDIDRCVKEHRPDLIIIDQLSLMKDYRGGKDTRQEYKHISADILTYAGANKIPFIVVAQANRNAAMRKSLRKSSSDDNGNKDMEDVDAPETHEIMECDNIGQDAKKIIALSKTGNILNIVIRKGRNGGEGNVIKMNWNIDRGIFKPIVNTEDVDTLRSEHGF